MTKNESLQKLKDLEKSLDDPEVMGRLDKIIDRYMSIAEEIEKKVRSKEYKDWLYTTLLNKKSICDNTDCDDIIDVENAELLGSFHYYLESLAEKYDAAHHWVDNDSYLFFRIRDRYFRICTIYGQGSMTWVEALSDKPPYKFVDLNEA